jgi:hypothetical protein
MQVSDTQRGKKTFSLKLKISVQKWREKELKKEGTSRIKKC